MENTETLKIIFALFVLINLVPKLYFWDKHSCCQLTLKLSYTLYSKKSVKVNFKRIWQVKTAEHWKILNLINCLKDWCWSLKNRADQFCAFSLLRFFLKKKNQDKNNKTARDLNSRTSGLESYAIPTRPRRRLYIIRKHCWFKSQLYLRWKADQYPI